jgi:hypothetical protein
LRRRAWNRSVQSDFLTRPLHCVKIMGERRRVRALSPLCVARPPRVKGRKQGADAPRVFFFLFAAARTALGRSMPQQGPQSRAEGNMCAAERKFRLAQQQKKIGDAMNGVHMCSAFGRFSEKGRSYIMHARGTNFLFSKHTVCVWLMQTRKLWAYFDFVRSLSYANIVPLYCVRTMPRAFIKISASRHFPKLRRDHLMLVYLCCKKLPASILRMPFFSFHVIWS